MKLHSVDVWAPTFHIPRMCVVIDLSQYNGQTTAKPAYLKHVWRSSLIYALDVKAQIYERHVLGCTYGVSMFGSPNAESHTINNVYAHPAIWTPTPVPIASIREA